MIVQCPTSNVAIWLFILCVYSLCCDRLHTNSNFINQAMSARAAARAVASTAIVQDEQSVIYRVQLASRVTRLPDSYFTDKMMPATLRTAMMALCTTTKLKEEETTIIEDAAPPTTTPHHRHNSSGSHSIIPTLPPASVRRTASSIVGSFHDGTLVVAPHAYASQFPTPSATSLWSSSPPTLHTTDDLPERPASVAVETPSTSTSSASSSTPSISNGIRYDLAARITHFQADTLRALPASLLRQAVVAMCSDKMEDRIVTELETLLLEHNNIPSSAATSSTPNQLETKDSSSHDTDDTSEQTSPEASTTTTTATVLPLPEPTIAPAAEALVAAKVAASTSSTAGGASSKKVGAKKLGASPVSSPSKKKGNSPTAPKAKSGKKVVSPVGSGAKSPTKSPKSPTKGGKGK
jgi:hypothetical protein